METINDTVVPDHYNPNQLVTYKVISNGTTTYPTTKVTEVEWALESYRTMKERFNSQSQSVANLEEMLAGWIDNANDAETIVSEICDLFGFNPTKEIEFEGTISFSGVISVPLKDIADFDIDSVQFDVDINSYDADIDIQNVDVDNVIAL
jgi:hypothetical protein